MSNPSPPPETEDITITVSFKPQSAHAHDSLKKLRANALIHGTTPERLLSKILARRLGPTFEVLPA